MADDKVEIWFSLDGDPCEAVLATPAGDGRYRLEETPAMSCEASLGDIVEVRKEANENLTFQQLVEKARYRTHRYLIPREFAESAELRTYCDSVQRAGGQWERLMGGYLILHVPETSGIDTDQDVAGLLSAYFVKKGRITTE